MRSCFLKPALILAFSAVIASEGFASPLTSKLLSLVPSGSEIVAGFENHHDAQANGRLLLTTQFNRLDLDDWLALAGVDTGRIFDEVIEVASSPAGGLLNEHLLLVAGHFDRDRIFRAAQQNGAQTALYEGEPVLLIQPFTRELQAPMDSRWLVILANQTAIFGTPSLVRQALTRYVTQALPDGLLTERLSHLRPDVSCWNVLVSPALLSGYATFTQPRAAWAQLLEDTDLFMVGARFGPKIRVDFSIHRKHDRGSAYLAQKAAPFTHVFAPDAPQQVDLPPAVEPRLESFLVEQNRVDASIELSRKQFNAWATRLSLSEAPRPPAEPPMTAVGGTAMR